MNARSIFLMQLIRGNLASTTFSFMANDSMQMVKVCGTANGKLAPPRIKSHLKQLQWAREQMERKTTEFSKNLSAMTIRRYTRIKKFDELRHRMRSRWSQLDLSQVQESILTVYGNLSNLSFQKQTRTGIILPRYCMFGSLPELWQLRLWVE